MGLRWQPSARAMSRAIAALCVVILTVVGVISYRSCVPGLTFEDGRAFAATLEPSAVDALGVTPDSSFTLTLGQSVPLGAVKDALSVEPPIDFRVRADDSEGKRFTVTPAALLEPDRVYRFVLALAGPDEPGYSWAYQVRSRPRVLGTLPGDRSAGVPTNTGIEIQFSHEDVDDPGAHFSISPFVPGRWERHRRTLVYVPTTPLHPRTVYTCTVKAGLGVRGSDETTADDYTFSFETAAAPGGVEPDFYFWVEAEELEFATSEAPFFSANYGRYGTESPSLPRVRAQVYRYRDASHYLAGLEERNRAPYWAYETRRAFRPSLAGLEKVLDADLDMREVRWQMYIALPEPLPAGYYLAVFRLDSYVFHTWFQVTDLSAYVVEARNDTVVWFNSLTTGLPVTGVTVRAQTGGDLLGSSGQDGLARFATPAAIVGTGDRPARDEPVPPFYVTARAPDGSEFTCNLSPWWGPYWETQMVADGYWSYLFTDRPLYLPDDEVCFWGVLEPRDRGVPEQRRITVELRSTSYCWEGPFAGRYSSGRDGDADLILSTEVDVDRHVYDGRLDLPNLRPGYYRLEVVAGDVTLATRWFEVATYTKPAYRIGLTADKRAIFAGDTVDFTLEAAFFEGTPVSELRLQYNLNAGGGTSRSGFLVTDMTGRATLSYTGVSESDPFVLERHDYLRAYADLPESGPIHRAAGVRVFTKDALIRARTTYSDTSVTVEAAVNEVDIGSLNAGGDDAGWYGGDCAGPALGGWSIAGRLEEIRIDKREIGEYYDFIAKVTRKVYDYVEVKVLVESFSMTTDELGQASWTFVPDQSKKYRVVLTTSDRAGRSVATETFVWGRGFDYPEGDYRWYHLAAPDRTEREYAVGETVTVVAREGDHDLPSRTGGYLFYTARLGLETVEVVDGPGYEITFQEDYIPNINIGGVYFDGRYYNILGEFQAGFAYDVRGLDVTVSTDQVSYAPGDRAVIAVEVKDTEGRPVAAEVNLSMIDEALFALSDQTVDLLGSLYGRRLNSYILVTRASHYQRLVSGGSAECGEGEGGGERSDFLDNALFSCLSTGSDGRATTEVVLPDNLTSWRLTFQAYAQGVRAGSGTLSVPVRLPFFVELSTNETYLTGDRPVIHARAYGEVLPSGTPVAFTARLGRLAAGDTYDYRDLGTVTGTAFHPAGIVLGTLERGIYRLSVTGKATLPDGTALEDTLVRSLEVVDTYLTLDRVDYYEVGEGLRLEAEPGELATLVFCDRERGKYLEMLWRLACGGPRVDMKTASLVARRILSDEFASDERVASGWLGAGPTASDLLVFQRPEGGVALLPYADPDLELTAKVAALGDIAGFDQGGFAAYLGQAYDREDETRERYIVSLYGLAALGQPVLTDVQRAAGQPDLSPKEKLYTCLALAALGDEEKARSIFTPVLQAFGDRIGPLMRLNVSRDREEVIAATSLAAVVAAQLALPEREPLFEYLLDNTPLEELNHLELALYLQEAVPAAPSEVASFTMEPGGTEIRLDPGETYTCVRTAEDLAGLRFREVHGSVGLCVSYRAPADLGGTKAGSGDATLTRAYHGEGGSETTTFGAGDLVKIAVRYRISARAPEGMYQLVDFLPSGLKAVPRAYEFGVQDANLRYPVEVDGQKLTFNVYFHPRVDPRTGQVVGGDVTDTVVYYARVVSLGTYQADAAVLVHAKSGEIFATTARTTIVIQ